jgi:hypothetical protein
MHVVQAVKEFLGVPLEVAFDMRSSGFIVDRFTKKAWSIPYDEEGYQQLEPIGACPEPTHDMWYIKVPAIEQFNYAAK